MKMTAAKWIGLSGFFGLTTGIVIPWLISNDVLPLPVIMLAMFFVAMIWVALLEKPVRNAFKKLKELDNERH